METYILRHFLAALKYRGAAAIEQAPASYPAFDAGNGNRNPLEILGHISAVLRYAQSFYDPDIQSKAALGTWEEEVARFYREIERLDRYLQSEGLPHRQGAVETLVQGPLSDALSHVGQLAMLRRLAGAPVPKENYAKADIRVPASDFRLPE